MNKSVANKLKLIIEKNGPDYLQREPYLVYKELIVSSDIDEKLAGAILLALVRKICNEGNCCNNREALPVLIQNECCLNEKMSAWLAEIFTELYSKENEDAWRRMKLNGWKQFLKLNLTCKWEGFSVWSVYGGSVACHFEADFILKPAANLIADEELSRALCENPFMTQDKITEHYKKKICKYLDYEFEQYCTYDDYYQPVVEDFEICYRVENWCNENKFELVSCEGDGYDNGYEPSF